MHRQAASQNVAALQLECTLFYTACLLRVNNMHRTFCALNHIQKEKKYILYSPRTILENFAGGELEVQHKQLESGSVSLSVSASVSFPVSVSQSIYVTVQTPDSNLEFASVCVCVCASVRVCV